MDDGISTDQVSFNEFRFMNLTNLVDLYLKGTTRKLRLSSLSLSEIVPGRDVICNSFAVFIEDNFFCPAG